MDLPADAPVASYRVHTFEEVEEIIAQALLIAERSSAPSSAYIPVFKEACTLLANTALVPKPQPQPWSAPVIAVPRGPH